MGRVPSAITYGGVILIALVIAGGTRNKRRNRMKVPVLSGTGVNRKAIMISQDPFVVALFVIGILYLIHWGRGHSFRR